MQRRNRLRHLLCQSAARASFFLLALLVSTATYAQQKYSSKDDGFSTEIPSDWIIDDSGLGGALAGFFSPKEQKGLVVVKTVRCDEKTTEEVADAFRNDMLGQKAKLSADEKLIVDGKEAHLFVIGRNDKDGAKTIDRMLVAVHNRKAYWFMFTVPVSHRDEVSDAFARIQKNIKWKSAPRRVYQSKDKQFSVHVPVKWTVDEYYQGSDKVVLVSPIVQKHVHAVIRIESYPSYGQTLTRFVDKRLENPERTTEVKICNYNEDDRYLLFNLIDGTTASRTFRLADKDCAEVTFALNHYRVSLHLDSDDQNTFKPPATEEFELKVVQTMIPVGDKVFVVSLVTFADSIDLTRPLYDRVLETLEFSTHP